MKAAILAAILRQRPASEFEFVPAIDQPVIASGSGNGMSSFATATAYPFKRMTSGDNSTNVDTENDPCYRYPGIPAGYLIPSAANNVRVLPVGYLDWQFEFVTSSKYVGIVRLSSAANAALQIIVNGKPLAAESITWVGTANVPVWLTMEFPDRRPRKIKVITGPAHQLYSPLFEADYPPVKAASAGRVLAVISDSFAGGSGVPPTGATRLDTWPQWTARALGFEHCVNMGVGGTGWVNAGPSTVYGGPRLTALLNLAPDAVIFAGSRNDPANASVTTAIQTALDTVLASIPANRIFMTGTFTALGQNTFIQNGAVSRGVSFIDMTDGFQAGDIGGDGVHPTYAGAVNLRNRFIPRLLAAGCVPREPEPEFDTDAAAYFASLTTPLSLPTRIAINSHVLALKSSGVWAALDWYLLLANETEEAAYRNLRNPAKTASAVNAPPWTQWLGSSGNPGASAHVACSDEFIFAGSNYTLDAAHVGFLCNRNDTNATPTTIGPAGNISVHYSLPAPGANENANFNNSGFIAARVSTGSAGDRVGTRGGADASRWSYNGEVSVDPGAASSAPTGLACIHRRNTLYGSRRIAIFHFGGPLTHAQIGALYNAKYAYLETIGGLGDMGAPPGSLTVGSDLLTLGGEFLGV